MAASVIVIIGAVIRFLMRNRTAAVNQPLINSVQAYPQQPSNIQTTYTTSYQQPNQGYQQGYPQQGFQ